MADSGGNGNGKKAAAAAGVVALLLLLGGGGYFGFGPGKGLGAGTDGRDSAKQSAEQVQSAEENADDRTRADDTAQLNDTAEGNKQALWEDMVPDVIVVTIKEDKVTINGNAVSDKNELRKFVEEYNSDARTFTLEEEQSILGTYNWVKEAFDELDIQLKNAK